MYVVVLPPKLVCTWSLSPRHVVVGKFVGRRYVCESLEYLWAVEGIVLQRVGKKGGLY